MDSTLFRIPGLNIRFASCLYIIAEVIASFGSVSYIYIYKRGVENVRREWNGTELKWRSLIFGSVNVSFYSSLFEITNESRWFSSPFFLFCFCFLLFFFFFFFFWFFGFGYFFCLFFGLVLCNLRRYWNGAGSVAMGARRFQGLKRS